MLESGSWDSLRYFHIGGELHERMILTLSIPLQLLVMLLEHRDYGRVKAGTGFHLDMLHRIFERNRTAILPVGRQCIEAINGRENARAHGNLFATQAIGISAAVPLLVVRANDRNHGIRELHAFEN